MSYRAKLRIAFILLVLLAVSLMFGLTYFHARSMVFAQIQSTVLSIAATASPLVDGESHQQLQEGDDESEIYKNLAKMLRGVRDQQERNDIEVIYVYTMRPADPENPDGDWIYVVDAGEEEEKPLIGDLVEFEAISGEAHALAEGLAAPFVEEAFIQDEFGVFLSAAAPIFDASGDGVAVLGVDIAADDVALKLHQLRIRGLIALAMTIILGVALAVFLSTIATGRLRKVQTGVNLIGKGELETRIEDLGQDEFGQLAEEVNRMASSLQERAVLKDAFAKYVSSDIADRMLKNNEQPALEGTRQKVTILFSDIRGFTALSEELPPEEVVARLNEYFERMVEIVFSNKGTIDKFLGDGLMAVFGAPLEDAEQELHAVKTMIEMEEAASEISANWLIKGQKPLHIGMAVHTGEAIVGNIGSMRRMDYTAIGRTVNISARLEAKTKEYETCGLISEITASALKKDQFDLVELGSAQLRGVSQELKIFTLPQLQRSGTKSGPTLEKMSSAN
ncbi:MAG: adenylate/guanylate cyclase domain-containing protein [Verrucomicrobiota bacterium]